MKLYILYIVIFIIIFIKYKYKKKVKYFVGHRLWYIYYEYQYYMQGSYTLIFSVGGMLHFFE